MSEGNIPTTGAQQVAAWLEGDPVLTGMARTSAHFSKTTDPDYLRQWAGRLLYSTVCGLGSPDGDFNTLRAWGADIAAARTVRDGFTREEFDGIDWTAVRDSLAVC